MYVIMFVLDNPNNLDKILEAWQNAGISGVTIIESTGVHRRAVQKQRIPYAVSICTIICWSRRRKHYPVNRCAQQRINPGM